jgi:hypothetical protein
MTLFDRRWSTPFHLHTDYRLELNRKVDCLDGFNHHMHGVVMQLPAGKAQEVSYGHWKKNVILSLEI